MNGKKLGHGILGWDGSERRGDRYGAIHLGSNDYEESSACEPFTDRELLEELQGKRVRLTAVVTATRQSGHIGDLFHGFVPSTPDVGEVVDLGVGVLDAEAVGWSDSPTVVLKPGDGRPTFWYDPRKLYRLHDQTVDLFVEETDDPFTEVAGSEPAEEDGVVSTGDEDGSLQTKNVDIEDIDKVCPEFERVGEPEDHMFVMDFTPRKGKRFQHTTKPKDED
jgi:hypothetical protein